MFDGISKKVFFIGIGGISMSGLAIMLKSRGHEIAGSDETLSNITEKLNSAGIKVYHGHNESNIKGYDTIVYTAAISDNNPELINARKLGKQVISRAELLGIISRSFKTTIAISGSHGKTTTTAMISSIMIDANKKPSVHIGAEFDKIKGNVLVGGKDIFITEACEYKDSFLKVKSNISVILNVQPDHLDYFKSFSNEILSFKKFAENSKGIVIINDDDENSENIQSCLSTIITYSCRHHADYQAKNFKMDSLGCYSFDCIEYGRFLGRFHLSVKGRHNIYNALAAIIIARQFDINYYDISKSLKNFYGAKRRFEQVGFINGASVIHDYAHHPTEIKSSIEIARSISKGRVITVFQPHTYSRTRDLFDDFAKVLSSSDEVIMYPIYAAREDPILGITSDKLSERINKLKTKSFCIKSYDEIYDHIKSISKSGDVVLIVGAGDIVNLCKYFKND